MQDEEDFVGDILQVSLIDSETTKAVPDVVEPQFRRQRQDRGAALQLSWQEPGWFARELSRAAHEYGKRRGRRKRYVLTTTGSLGSNAGTASQLALLAARHP